jgi:hypothetical protein
MTDEEWQATQQGLHAAAMGKKADTDWQQFSDGLHGCEGNVHVYSDNPLHICGSWTDMTVKDGIAWLDAAAQVDLADNVRVTDVLGFGLILAALMVFWWVWRRA